MTAFKKHIVSIVDKVKKKKQVVVYLFGGVFLVILLSAIFLNKKPIEQDKKPEQTSIEIEPGDSGLSSWQAQSADQLSSISERVGKLSLVLEKQRKLYEDIEGKFKDLNQILEKQQKQINKIEEFQETSKSNTFSISNLEKLKHLSVSSYPILPSQSRLKEIPEPQDHIVVSIPSKIESPSHQIALLPVGSFFQAVLLNGVEAGTGQETESNPQPVLMRIIDNAFLPNEYRFKIKSCFILGSGYGSLSSERVYIRTARISCVNNGGNSVISESIEGYIVDSDGKIGLRGTLVSRQGTKLGMAMLAGFSNGIATAFGSAQSTSSVSASGVTNTVTPTQSLRRAGLGGMSSVSQELAQFYINQAQNIYPVIDINNGRVVTVTISQSVHLNWKSIHDVFSELKKEDKSKSKEDGDDDDES